jgi:CubicO group peptidase (beta-lactamase class C family)
MRKFFKRFLIVVLIFLAAIAGCIYFSGRTYLFTALTYWFANVDDYTIFKNNTVTTGNPQEWPVSEAYNKVQLPDSLRLELEKWQSLGLVVIHKDSLLYEQYWKGYSDSSWSGSFSVAKSIVSILIGTAIQDGLIESVLDPVGKYLPEWNEGEKANVRIKDLLTMSSGTNWNESYKNPLSVTTEAYYGTDLEKTIGRLKMVDKPGTKFIYKSGDTQILGFILTKVTGKSLAALAAEKLWHPLGAQHPALWSIDKVGGHEKAYCCFNTNARDFARIGQLMLDSGVWNGQRIIPEQYYLESIRPSYIPDEEQLDCDYYGYQWWIYPKVAGVFYARGILGQFIIVIPQKDMVIVRLGEKMGDIYRYHTPELVQELVQWGMNL